MWPVKDLVPNEFNPNQVPPDQYIKLKRNVLETWEKDGVIPPVITRNTPGRNNRQEIIDGYHRYLIFKDEGIPEIPIISLGEVPKARAQRMCINLNYLRGDPDPKSYVALLEDMMQEEGWGAEEASLFIPESADAIEDMLALLGNDDPTFEWDGADMEDLYDSDGDGGGGVAAKPTANIEVTMSLPIDVAKSFEEARATLYDVLFDPSSHEQPEVDATLTRLTCALVRRKIATADDVFTFLKKG